jgi:hypothetical protein
VAQKKRRTEGERLCPQDKHGKKGQRPRRANTENEANAFAEGAKKNV